MKLANNYCDLLTNSGQGCEDFLLGIQSEKRVDSAPHVDELFLVHSGEEVLFVASVVSAVNCGLAC